jgi:hypothetical protein
MEDPCIPNVGEAIEDQIDRLNHLLKDVMSDFTNELQLRPSFSATASPTRQIPIPEPEQTLQLDTLQNSYIAQDNFTEFNFSTYESECDEYVEEERLLA